MGKKNKTQTPVVNPVVADATAKPVPGVKYALKQVYRDPITRKAFVFFVDSNTGAVLSSLEGYQLWEAGRPTTPGTGTPTTPTTTGQTSTAPQQTPINEQERYLGRGEDREGKFGSWLTKQGFDSVPPEEGVKNNKEQSVVSETFPGGQGRITVTGQGSATEGTYNVNTPSMNNRTPSDVVSGTRQTSGVQQGFTTNDVGFSFGTPTTSAQNSASTQGIPTGGGNLSGYYDKNANEVPADVWAGYVASEASKRGLNPEMMSQLARAEGLNNLAYQTPNLQATATLGYGREKSYGALQIHAGPKNDVHYKDFKTQTGFELDDPSVPAEMARIQYGLNLAAQKGNLKDWVNSSNKLFGTTNPKGLAVGKLDAYPITVTTEVVAAGLLPGAELSGAIAQAPNEFTTGNFASGIGPAADVRSPGSGAPAIQDASLYERAGMSGVNTDKTTYGMSRSTLSMDEAPGFYSTGWGVVDQNLDNRPEFTQKPSFTSLGRALSSRPIADQTAMSQIGRNPTTGDEFAVAREMERQTAANFASGPIESRTLSGPISNQGIEKGAQNVANNPNARESIGYGLTQPSTQQTQSFVDRQAIDYGNVASGKGSIVASSGGLRYNDKTNTVTTQGKTDIVVSNVLPNGAGLHIPGDESIQYEIDTKTGKMAAIATGGNLKSQMTANSINNTLALQGKLMDGVKPSPMGAGLSAVGSLVSGGAKIVGREQTAKLMEEFGPKSNISMNPVETSVITPAREIYDQRLSDIQSAGLANPSTYAPDRTAYDKMVADIASSGQPNAERMSMTFGGRPQTITEDTGKFYDPVPNYDFAQQGPNLSGIDRKGPKNPFASSEPRYDDNNALARSWENSRSVVAPPSSQTEYDSFIDRMSAIGAYDQKAGVLNYDRVPQNDSRYASKDSAFDPRSQIAGFGQLSAYANKDDAFSNPSFDPTVGRNLAPDIYQSATVANTINPGAYTFGNTPVGGLPARDKSWGEVVADMAGRAARGFAEGIGTAMTGMVGGSFGMGGRQEGGRDTSIGWGDGGRGLNSPGEGGSRFGGSGLGYSGRGGNDSPSENGGRFGGGGLGYSGLGGQDSPSEGGGRFGGGGLGDSRGGGGYSGLGGNDSPSEGRSSGPGGGANTGGGFNSGGGYTGGGPTGGGGSGSNNSTGVSGYTGGGYNNESSFGGPR